MSLDPVMELWITTPPPIPICPRQQFNKNGFGKVIHCGLSYSRLFLPLHLTPLTFRPWHAGCPVQNLSVSTARLSLGVPILWPSVLPSRLPRLRKCWVARKCISWCWLCVSFKFHRIPITGRALFFIFFVCVVSDSNSTTTTATRIHSRVHIHNRTQPHTYLIHTYNERYKLQNTPNTVQTNIRTYKH